MYIMTRRETVLDMTNDEINPCGVGIDDCQDVVDTEEEPFKGVS